MGFNSLKDVLQEQLEDLHSAETQLVSALPKMAQAASTDPLREAFQHHLEETREHLLGGDAAPAEVAFRDGHVLEVRSRRRAEGGFVLTSLDITRRDRLERERLFGGTCCRVADDYRNCDDAGDHQRDPSGGADADRELNRQRDLLSMAGTRRRELD